MTLRMAGLALFIAALPLSIDAPSDSTARHGEIRLEAAGSLGQYGIVTRGCENQVIDVVHRQLRSGALVVEHESPAGVVIGVRGGQVREHQSARTVSEYYGTRVEPGFTQVNRYVNPYAGWEGEWAGFGAGWLRSDHAFASGTEDRMRPEVSAHVRFGNRTGTSYALRFMEDVPLQSTGNLTMELTFHPSPGVELGPVVGLAGPWDGALLGVHGRFWLTPAASAQVRASVGGFQQYGVTGGVSLRLPVPR